MSETDKAMQDIRAERYRQKMRYPGDDHRTKGELARLAAAYAVAVPIPNMATTIAHGLNVKGSFKQNHKENVLRAAALLVAEYERLLRIEQRKRDEYERRRGVAYFGDPDVAPDVRDRVHNPVMTDTWKCLTCGMVNSTRYPICAKCSWDGLQYHGPLTLEQWQAAPAMTYRVRELQGAKATKHKMFMDTRKGKWV